MKVYKEKTLKRLRKKNLPACELMSQSEYDEWMTEEVLRYKRTRLLTADVMFGVRRGIRSAVALVCKSHNLTCFFDDIMSDVTLSLAEKWLFQYDPIKSRISYFLSYIGFRLAEKRINVYHTEHMQSEDWHEQMSPEPQDKFLMQDFIFDRLPTIQWRMHPTICRWIALFILAGVSKKVVLKALHETILENRPFRCNLLYDYTLVTVRIELADKLERHSGGVLS